MDWISCDIPKRLKYAVELLKFVRFPFITRDYLFAIVENGKLMEWLEPQDQLFIKNKIITSFHYSSTIVHSPQRNALPWKKILESLPVEQKREFTPRQYLKSKIHFSWQFNLKEFLSSPISNIRSSSFTVNGFKLFLECAKEGSSTPSELMLYLHVDWLSSGNVRDLALCKATFRYGLLFEMFPERIFKPIHKPYYAVWDGFTVWGRSFHNIQALMGEEKYIREDGVISVKVEVAHRPESSFSSHFK